MDTLIANGEKTILEKNSDSVDENCQTRFHTYGCKVNTYDTGLLQKNWTSPDISLGKLHIFNTCAVTAEATKEALREIQRVKAREPNSKIVVTGCSAQVDTELFESCSAVDLIIGNSHKDEIGVWTQRLLAGDLSERVVKSNIFKKSPLGAGGGKEASHTRSFLKIQDGCNSFCTYCVIPFARGRSRSLTEGQIISEIQSLSDQGVKEVVLTGIHIGDYRTSTGQGIESLVESLLMETSMPRIRLTSLEPTEVSAGLLDLFSSERLCPHFHMSIQSACTKILRSMKRQYTGNDVVESLRLISKRVPHAFVGMDVIVGFPGEDDFDFEVTASRLKKLPWTKIHVFPYSERPSTYAHRLRPKVLPEVISERAKVLRALSHERHLSEAKKQVGKTESVLILKPNPKRQEVRGLGRNYWPVVIPNEHPRGIDSASMQLEVGQEVQIKVLDILETDKRPLQLIGAFPELNR